LNIQHGVGKTWHMTKYHALQRLLRLLAIACGLGMLASCSMIRVGYGQLDTIVAWRANDYFDLDAQQKDEFLRRFRQLHEWHRYEQLPDYAAFLAQTRARLDKPLMREDVLWFIEGAKARYAAIVARGSDDAAALLLTITPAQLEALQRQWDKDNRRFVREYRLSGSVEDIKRARVRRTLEQTRDWVGALSYEQEQRIIAMVNALPLTEKLRHDDRVRRQQEFIKLMAQRGGDREQFAARLHQWLTGWEKGRTPEYEARFNEWFEQRVQLVIEIERMLKPHQREIALQRLQNYIDDFTKLAGQRDVRTAAQ
jgi:hypothetical protein